MLCSVSTTRAKRVRRLCGATALVVVVAVCGYSWYGNHTAWNHIRSQANRFSPPAQWTPVGKAQEGSGACVISCDSPRVTLVYRTSAKPLDACDEARAAVAAQIGPAPFDANGWCGWQAR